MSNRVSHLWLATMALAVTACAPSVPDLRSVDESVVRTAPPTTSAPPTTTTVAPTTTTTTAAPTTTAVAITTTAADREVLRLTAGPWMLEEETRDESGDQFTATVRAPVLNADVSPSLLAKVETVVDGHVESQIGATLALWRSLEGQGDRDLSESVLMLDFNVAGFVEQFLSLRFFSEESLVGSGAVKRQVTTLMLDLESGTPLGLDDVVLDGESRGALLTLVQQSLLSEYFAGDKDAYTLWAGNLTPADLDSAVLTPQGIEVWFDELEVGPPDIGTPVIAIGYDELDGLLAPNGPGALLTG